VIGYLIQLNYIIKSNHAFLSRTAILSVLLLAACQTQAQPVYVFSTVAGDGAAGETGNGGAATSAELNSPAGVALDSAHTLYIADELNHMLRQVANQTQVIETVAGNGTAGYSGDKGQATAAELDSPLGVVVDSSGNFYIADSVNNVIRMVTPGDIITTVVGDNALGAGFYGDGGAPLNAALSGPSGLAMDAAGNLYIADTGNSRIRKVSFTANTIETIAGSSNVGYTGDGNPATIAELNSPRGLAIDSSGNVYIADSGNHVIRMISAITQKISTVAGNGTLGYNGDNIAATSAELNYPLGVAVDTAGNLYIADSQNFRIRMVTNNVITTIAGTGQPGYGGDGYYATIGLMTFPSALVVDPSTGNVYVADSGSNAVRLLTKVAAPIGPPLVNTGGVVSASEFGQFASAAPSSWIEIYGSSLALDSRAWRTSDFTGINAPEILDGTSVTIGGEPAYVEYISGGQLVVQVPSDIGTGPQRVVVTTSIGASVPYVMSVEPLKPGLYAPALTNLSGTQYVWALLPDGSIALPTGSVPGVVSRPANPGETMVMFGVGFGPVSPAIPAGQTVQQDNQLVEPFHVFFGGVPAAAINYAGLAPSAIGLYQFNVVVPNVSSGSAVPLTFTLGNETGAQSLFTAVN
jgi:uncharacterized protein (TIGR03437 family)